MLSAVEELAVNTVRYSFSEGRTNIIDIRLIIKDDEYADSGIIFLGNASIV